MISASQLRSHLEAVLEPRIPRALTPPQRPEPEMMSTGIVSVDSITGGIPLGCLTEICGPSSSGRTSVLLAAIAECMRRGEICALVDAGDAFDPQSAANAGVDLGRLLWVRCGNASGERAIGSSGEVKRGTRHSVLGVRPATRFAFQQNVQKTSPAQSKKLIAESLFTSPDHPITRSPDLEQALKTTDLLLQAGGFGLIVLDLADVPISAARRIPLTTWFRFRRSVENTSTALIVVEQHPHAKSCASLVMDFAAVQASWSEAADQNGTPVAAHGIPVETGHTPSPVEHPCRIETRQDASLPITNDAVAFRVTPEGVAIPFHQPMTSSFETPQRWNTPRARLLNTVHVHLQVTRSRMNRAAKFPVCSESDIPKAAISNKQ